MALVREATFDRDLCKRQRLTGQEFARSTQSHSPHAVRDRFTIRLRETPGQIHRVPTFVRGQLACGDSVSKRVENVLSNSRQPGRGRLPSRRIETLKRRADVDHSPSVSWAFPALVALAMPRRNKRFEIGSDEGQEVRGASAAGKGRLDVRGCWRQIARPQCLILLDVVGAARGRVSIRSPRRARPAAAC
jgi:hypothetical protein